MDNHPSSDILESRSSLLKGRKIILALCGSVAVMESVKLARLLMRHGAEIFPVMSESALSLIGKDLVHWACGNAPVTKLTGEIEHIRLAGKVAGRADLLLIAPATANTIGKIAAGIDDTVVTTVATTALGNGIPLMIVPAMHESMYEHTLVLENIRKLEHIGVRILAPRVEEDKAKIHTVKETTDEVIRLLHSNSSIVGKKILVTAGRTVEYLDTVRVLTNNSTGRMGIALARAAWLMGAEVHLVCGKVSVPLPHGVNCYIAETAEVMKNQVETLLKTHQIDVLYAAAAVGDWQPLQKAESKISTHTTESLPIELTPTPKIIDQVKDISPATILVAFRTQTSMSEEEMIAGARQRMLKARADFIALNNVELKDRGFESERNEIILINQTGQYERFSLALKEHIAMSILERTAMYS